MQRILDIGVNEHWGLFSQSIPTRVGYSCSQYWKKLIRKQYVIDMNVVNIGNNIWIWKWKNSIKDIAELNQCKKYAFTVYRDESQVWTNLPQSHPQHPSENSYNLIEQKYTKYFSKKYQEYMKQSNQNNPEPPRKRRKL